MSTSSSQKVLVTGGSGYVGSVLVDYLIQKDLSVCVVDTSPPSKSTIEFVQEDIRNVSENIFKNVSSVIHLAAFSNEIAAEQNSHLTKQINTASTTNLAKKAKNMGVKRFIFASSAAIYDMGIEKADEEKTEDSIVNPSGTYSISKYKAEMEILPLSDDNFSVVVLRKATVCGYSPRMRFDLVVNAMVKSALSQGHIKIFNKGLQWRPHISVNDVSAAYYKAITEKKEKIAGRIFNIVYGNFLVKDIATLIQKVLENNFSIETKIIAEGNDTKGRSYRMTKQKATELLDFTAKETIEDVVIDLVRKFKEKSI